MHREKNTYGLPQGAAIRRELISAFRIQRSAVLHWIETGEVKPAGKGTPLALKKWPELPRWPGWEAFGLGALKLSERMTPLLRAIWDWAAKRFAPKVGLDPDEWSVVDKNTERMIQQAALAFCRSTLETTELEIVDAIEKTREALNEGVVQYGESVEHLTKRINAIFKNAEKWRARRIAATEASRAVHAAQEQTAIQSEVVAGWKPLLSADACSLCRTIARRCPAVRLGQPFAIIGDHPDYSTIKFAPYHPLCQCTVVEILDIDAAGVEWGQTLIQPKPEAEDEAEESHEHEEAADLAAV